MSLSYQIMPLGINDFSQMMAIERGAFEQPWSASVMKDSLFAAHTRVWGIFHEEEGESELIGFGVISIILDESELLDMAIAKDFQGKGYGQVLMDFLVKKAAGNGAEKMFLEVRASNKRAIHVYKKLGFKLIHVRKKYYRAKNNTFEDAKVFERLIQA